ncbi:MULTISPECIES: 5-(carboxyamino)imidazole ribonucleotide synthase [Vagococcus]|uniref:5-(carboxyamino)imidazole ribonucleotide synthase n=1 Tax=Vagococcus TaxID=2737 RepID=UPI002FC5D694
MSEIILPGSTIGIIGGRHISKMLVMSAKKYGLTVGILDPLKNSPAAQVADWHIEAEYNDEHALLELAQKSDVLIYETRNLDTQAIDFLKDIVLIPQGTFGLGVTQDRLIERAFLDNHSINILPYETAVVISDIKEAAQIVGYPCVVKSTRRYGEEESIVVIQSEDEVDLAVPLIQQGACIVESYVSLKKELFLSIGINGNGEYSLFPIVETIHNKQGELKKIKAPIDIQELDDSTQNQIKLIARVIASELNVSGVVGVEFFINESGNLFVNEISSIAHESSSYSLDACDFSEYDIHIRGICNWPLPKIEQLRPAITFNITEDNYDTILFLLNKKRQWHFHFYQYPKEVGAVKGHVTILSSNIEETIQEIKHAGLLND